MAYDNDVGRLQAVSVLVPSLHILRSYVYRIKVLHELCLGLFIYFHLFSTFAARPFSASTAVVTPFWLLQACKHYYRCACRGCAG